MIFRCADSDDEDLDDETDEFGCCFGNYLLGWFIEPYFV